jgi:hypothetical protein
VNDDAITAPQARALAAGRLTALGTRVSVPGEPAYEQSQPWDLAVESHPFAVVHAEGPDDVVNAVRIAGQCDLRVAVRATGHGAFPLDDEALLVHTAGLDDCQIDPRARRARIGAGVRWSTVVTEAAVHGLAPVCGSAPEVGAIGFLTGGGLGPLSRSQGLGSDRVRAFEVVTGTGRLLRATPTENEDLFWGLRGGKATLGIVTTAEIELLPAESFYGGAVWFDWDDAAAVLRQWLTLCDQLPDAGTSSAAIVRLPPLPELPPQIAGRQTLAVRFGWTGDPDDGAAHLQQLRDIAAPLVDDVRVRPMTEIGRVHNDPTEPMPVCASGALLQALPVEAIEPLLRHADPASNLQIVIELRQLGGEIARVPEHPSAICHRDAAFALFMTGVPIPDAGPLAEQTAQILTGLTPWLHEGLLTNFNTDCGRAAIARCYDRDARTRLEDLGDLHDPGGVLRTGQVMRR